MCVRSTIIYISIIKASSTNNSSTSLAGREGRKHPKKKKEHVHHTYQQKKKGLEHNSSDRRVLSFSFTHSPKDSLDSGEHAYCRAFFSLLLITFHVSSHLILHHITHIRMRHCREQTHMPRRVRRRVPPTTPQKQLHVLRQAPRH